MNATLPGSSLKDFARVLSCFSRVGDEVSLEVTTGKLQLSTINSSKSAFILITLDATRFERFEFLAPRLKRPTADTGEEDNTIRCRLQLRALLSIFRPRNIENKESKDSSVEKCELKLLHPSEDSAECQLLIRLVCKHGIRKTYKLQYEQARTMHAVTDKTICHNRFKVAAKAMKEVMDHFAPRAEELTLAVNEGNLLLTSFTEGIVNDKEILKQPIHTSISIDHKEFESMEVDEQVQITFGLREFKSLGMLCDLLGTDLSLYYSDAGKPLLVDFEKDGMTGEFVVATTADGERGAGTFNRSAQRNESAPRGQYQPRTIAPASNRTAEAQDFGSDAANEAGSQWRDQSVGIQDLRRIDSRTSLDRSRVVSRAESSPGSIPIDRSALFAPDPDSQDPEIQARKAQLRGSRNLDTSATEQPTYEETGNRFPESFHEDLNDTGFAGADHQSGQHEQERDYEDEEMELYADELNFDIGEEEIGPTQTQRLNKPKGLFD